MAMAATAAKAPKGRPPHLRIIAGRGEDKDGIYRDAAGKPIPKPLDVERGLPVKPDDLSHDAEYVWDLVIAQYESIGLLKPLDAVALEVGCETYARWKGAKRMRQQHGAIGQNSQGVVVAAWTRVESDASREFRAWCAEFGLTPAAENKVGGTGGGDGDDNPFA